MDPAARRSSARVIRSSSAGDLGLARDRERELGRLVEFSAAPSPSALSARVADLSAPTRQNAGVFCSLMVSVGLNAPCIQPSRSRSPAASNTSSTHRSSRPHGSRAVQVTLREGSAACRRPMRPGLSEEHPGAKPGRRDRRSRCARWPGAREDVQDRLNAWRRQPESTSAAPTASSRSFRIRTLAVSPRASLRITLGPG